MKFFNLYQNQFRFVCKSSRMQLYKKYYKFKKKNYKPNDNSDIINNEFINYITIKNKKQMKCRKLYQHNYYIKNKKKVISLKINIEKNKNKIEETNNTKLYNYHMNKEKVIIEKNRKKKESLILEWDFQNPC